MVLRPRIKSLLLPPIRFRALRRKPIEGVLALAGLALRSDYNRIKAQLEEHESRQVFHLTTPDYGNEEKERQIVDAIPQFGETDFADLSCWIFASSLINHRIVHQRVDEGSLLWRAVKMSGGPILEIGRAAGGSTLLLLGASGSRTVVSIDRAPFHAPITEHIFQRPDVSSRLRLYVQSSRDPIDENEFGMIFIDADHSYEGICHDIATFWRMLKPFGGRPAIAAFHDAADNPITYVEPVKQACDELLAEPGAARRVESWGSMLVVEKTGEIDEDRWYAKVNQAYWELHATREYPVLHPVVMRGQLDAGHALLRLGRENLLGEENLEEEGWVKRGMTVHHAHGNVDNPVRLVEETEETGPHRVERRLRLNARRVKFSIFLRPHRLKAIRISVLATDGEPLAQTDFHLIVRSEIVSPSGRRGAKILDAAFLYRNGFFGCDLAVDFSETLGEAIFAVAALAEDGATGTYRGDGKRGFFVNLWGVREIR